MSPFVRFVILVVVNMKGSLLGCDKALEDEVRTFVWHFDRDLADLTLAHPRRY
jgi:hypothetical protein